MATNHLDPTTAQKINDLRARILENQKQGLPPHAGIGREEMNMALAHLRQNRLTAANTAEKKRGAKKAKEAPVIIDLNDLFTKKD